MTPPPPARRSGGLGRGLGALIPSGPAVDLTTPAHGTPPAGQGTASSGSDTTVVGQDGTPAAPDTTPALQQDTSPSGSDTTPARQDTTAARQDTTTGRGAPSAALDGSSDEVASPGEVPARFAELPLDAITPNPLQPRAHFDEEAMAELVTSIREVGLLQPVVVRETGPGRYELVMGERRWRASQEAGTVTIPAIVRSTPDDVMLRDALLENLHRQELNPLEEAAAYAQLLEDFGVTHEELALRLGRSRPQVSNTIRLLQLPPAVQRRVAAGVLSAGHARAILGLPTPQAQEQMATRVVAEGLSVRGVEEAVQLAHADRDDGPAPRPRARRPVPSRLAEVADRLSDRLETRVKVDLGRARGKVTIEFATVEDLERIVTVIERPDRDSSA